MSTKMMRLINGLKCIGLNQQQIEDITCMVENIYVKEG